MGGREVKDAEKGPYQTQEWKDGIVARLLNNYADSLRERQKLGETVIDSDFPETLEHAARLLREHCPSVQKVEKARKKLLESVVK